MDEQLKKAHSDNVYEVLFGAFIITLIALCLAETAVNVIYYVVGTEDLLWHMTTTAAITVPITFPISFYILKQQRKLKALSLELAHLASTDQMSGLMNRTAFLTQVNELLRTPNGGPTAGSFLFVDADNFKSLNDNFGHATGDDAIKRIAEIIQNTSPNGSIAGRIGGEEFGVFIPRANKAAALSVAENIRRQVRKLIFEKGHFRHQLSVSIGGAIHNSGQSLSEFIQKADERMYLAKRKGRNCVTFDDPIENGQESDADLAKAI